MGLGCASKCFLSGVLCGCCCCGGGGVTMAHGVWWFSGWGLVC